MITFLNNFIENVHRIVNEPKVKYSKALFCTIDSPKPLFFTANAYFKLSINYSILSGTTFRFCRVKPMRKCLEKCILSTDQPRATTHFAKRKWLYLSLDLLPQYRRSHKTNDSVTLSCPLCTAAPEPNRCLVYALNYEAKDELSNMDTIWPEPPDWKANAWKRFASSSSQPGESEVNHKVYSHFFRQGFASLLSHWESELSHDVAHFGIEIQGSSQRFEGHSDTLKPNQSSGHGVTEERFGW